MGTSRAGSIAFLLGAAILAGWLNFQHQRLRADPTAIEKAQWRIVADLSNLPPALGPQTAPVTISVTLHPKTAGPCIKGTVEFVRQLVERYEGQVRARFRKVDHPSGPATECSADLTINGKKTFLVTIGGKTFRATLHGVARPGDPMSEIVRQVVEREIRTYEQRGDELADSVRGVIIRGRSGGLSKEVSY